MGKYGVGSCGPRGFYGTIDVHLELEVILTHRRHVECPLHEQRACNQRS